MWKLVTVVLIKFVFHLMLNTNKQRGTSRQMEEVKVTL